MKSRKSLRIRFANRPRRYLTQAERQLEHRRHRARLKRQPIGEEPKRERFFETYDRWSWD